jgi:hypothetical protein
MGVPDARDPASLLASVGGALASATAPVLALLAAHALRDAARADLGPLVAVAAAAFPRVGAALAVAWLRLG